jgi:hypothetical protein
VKFLAVVEVEDDVWEWGVCYYSIDGTLCLDAGTSIVDDWVPTHWRPLPVMPPK